MCLVIHTACILDIQQLLVAFRDHLTQALNQYSTVFKTQRFFEAKAFAGEFSQHRPAAQHEQKPLTA